MSKEQYASQPALGMPRPTRIALIVLSSLSLSALAIILAKMSKD